MTPEQYFLRYAFPCADSYLDRKKITKEHYQELENAFKNNTPIEREKLEKTFDYAFSKLKELAKGMKKDYWDIEVLREYFITYHNKCIDAGDEEYGKLPKTFKEFCKVKKCRLLKKEKGIFTVELEGIEKKVLGKMLPEAEEGDLIYIHRGVATEKA